MTRPEAAFFDLDKTIIAASSVLAFSKPFTEGGLITKRAMLRSAYAQLVFTLGGADHDQMEKMRLFLSGLVKGWDVAQVREIVAQTLTEIVDPLVYAEAVALMREHQEAGRHVIVVSASGFDVVEPIGRLLGADGVVATVLEVSEDGKYTGEILRYVYADEKARAILDLSAEHRYDLEASYAYSDSITDVPMLEAVGHAFAVNPDKELRKEAEKREWPILEFARPEALDPKPLPHAATIASLAVTGAVTGAVAVGGYVWANTRRGGPRA